MSRGGLVTLLWIVEGAPGGSAHVRDVAGSGVTVIEAAQATVEEAIVEARERGGVVALGDASAHASLLRLGADEVATWSASPTEVALAIGRARARATWRASNRDVHSPELDGLAFMSAAIGHEMRNSLAAAMINCTTIETLVGPTETTSELHGTISDLNEALKNMANVVNQMMALTATGELGVCELSRTLVELTTYVHREVEISADFEADIPSEPCVVGISRVRAVEVVASLLNNAVLAVEKLATRRPRISLRLTNEAEMIIVEVNDNGVGMTPEVRRQALNPFFTTRRPGALGMGLTFAAMNVRRAGGEILIDSEVDVGTSVRLFFPPVAGPPPAPRMKN
ncbi:MAG TPA: HAMP domain-containing sensor histidine kinase [Polyangiaceae bacterium]|jgi:C4-dicarboxylate-specific signal transduction histidine kinase